METRNRRPPAAVGSEDGVPAPPDRSRVRSACVFCRYVSGIVWVSAFVEGVEGAVLLHRSGGPPGTTWNRPRKTTDSSPLPLHAICAATIAARCRPTSPCPRATAKPKSNATATYPAPGASFASDAGPSMSVCIDRLGRGRFLVVGARDTIGPASPNLQYACVCPLVSKSRS